LENNENQNIRMQSCDNITAMDINGTRIDNAQIILNAMNQK
jgi:hypothetical protein